MNPKTFRISYAWDDQIETTQLGFDAYHGNEGAVRAAIAAGINWQEEGVEALHGALFGDKADCVDLLLQAGSPVEAQTHYIAYRVNPKLYENFLMKPIYEASLDAKTASINLVDSCRYGSLRLSRYFLEHQADPNEKNYSAPALHYAAAGFRRDLIQLLLDFGGDINIQEKRGFSTLRVMAASGAKPLDHQLRKEVYEFLVVRGAIAVPAFTPAEEAKAKNGQMVNVPN